MSSFVEVELNTYSPPRGPAGRAELGQQARACAEQPGLPAVLEAHPVPTMVLNSSRQIVAANAAARALSGKAASQLVGLRLGEAVGCTRTVERPGGCGTLPGCEVCGAALTFSRMETTGRAAYGECRVTTESASLDLRVSATPLTVGGEALSLCAVEDTSDTHRRQALERVFFHDALNVAGALQGYLSLVGALGPAQALDLGRRLAPLADQLVEEIQAQRDLLDAERGELVARHVDVPVAELFERVEAVYGGRAKEAGVGLTFGTTPAGTTVWSDPVLLRRVLGNLVKNALEASQPGDVVSIGFDVESGRFEVANPAVMSEAIARQVFQRSFTTKGGRGRGLGAYSVRLLTERYLGGKVAFHSTAGRGTRFLVQLPKVSQGPGDRPVPARGLDRGSAEESRPIRRSR